MTFRRNVLIFHAAALGDFVLTWPLAVALGRIYAQSRIIYVTGRDKGQLAERVLRLESTDVEGGWHHLYAADPGGLPERASRLLAGAHAVYLVGQPTPVWAANVGRLNPSASVIVLDPLADGTGHATERVLAQLADRKPEWEATRQILRSVADRGIGFGRTPGPDVVLHPGAGSPDKCWPADRYAELARQLRAAGRPVRIVLGEVEGERWSAATVRTLEGAADVRRPTTLLELLAEVSAASHFVGNDSGPAHLAGILGVRTLALFGPTDPARWRPLGPAVQTVQSGSATQLTVDQVLAHLV